MRGSLPTALLYIGGFEIPTAQTRGIQTIHTAHALARAGWTVRLLAQRGPGRRADHSGEVSGSYGLMPHPRLRIVALPTVRIRPMPGIDIHTRLALTNVSYGLGCLIDLLRGRSHADVVLARDPRLAWMFLRTKRLHRRPVVYEVHEIFSLRPRDNRSLDPHEVRGVADRTRALERAVFSEADLLLPLTRACGDLLAGELGVERSRLAVVPDGTTPPIGPLHAREATSRTIVYAGQLYPWKGVDVLIDATTHIPDARLVVYGGLAGEGGGDANLSTCRSLADRLGIADRVHFAGYVPHGRLRGHLMGATVAVVPLPERLMSRYFTSPLKVFEYMAAGVPIVASDLPAVREVLSDGENALLVPPNDPAALAAAVRRLLDDPPLAEHLRTRAYRDVLAYTWDRRAERIIEAVAPLMKRTSPRPRTRPAADTA